MTREPTFHIFNFNNIYRTPKTEHSMLIVETTINYEQQLVELFYVIISINLSIAGLSIASVLL